MAGCELRPYQKTALNQIRKHYSQKQKKVLLHLSTGGGKTVIFSEVLKGVYRKGKHGIMVVRGRKLVDQASRRLEREGVAHGVLMAGHKKYAPNEKIQICSIDTLRSRNLRPQADIVVIDEAHLATSPSYHSLINDYPDAFFLPVTATPYTEKSLRHIADHVVKPITFNELVEQGFLVPPRYFCPNVPNLKGVSTTATSEGKDYNQKQLAAIMEDSYIMGDIATEWLDKAKGRPTIAFCVSVSHSMKLTEYLIERGIRAAHVDANSSDEEREVSIAKLENREIDVLCNVGILCTGVDIPCLGCIIMARPTKSYNLFIQQAGRGTRPYRGKKDFILLDNAGNVLRHGFITKEREANLDAKEKIKKVEKTLSPKICTVCFAAFQGTTCPSCGAGADKNPRQYAVVDGNLKELKPDDLDPIKIRFEELKKIKKEKGYKRGWLYHKLKDEFSEEVASLYVPKRYVPPWVAR